jgi:hypothetical protein
MISVVVCTYNRATSLARTLDDLEYQRVAGNLNQAGGRASARPAFVLPKPSI